MWDFAHDPQGHTPASIDDTVTSIPREAPIQLDNVNQALLILQKAIEQMQSKLENLQTQLIFYWVQLQVLKRQSILCLESHQELVNVHREAAKATLHLTQYSSRSLTQCGQTLIFISYERRQISYTEGT